jgi:UDP-3-O-[3-hydroxymyristoyl] glucosamine N-acyltransferase
VAAIYSLQDLATHVGGSPSETPGPLICGVKPVEFAGADDITYVTSPAYAERFSRGPAKAALVPPGVDLGGKPVIVVNNPEAAYARLTALYYGYSFPHQGVSPKADVHPEATLGDNVAVGAFAVVERGASVGDGSVIGPHAFVGERTRIGCDVRIFSHVTIYPDVTIGDRVIVHAGTVIGSDGFGFARDFDETGKLLNVKKYHSGVVEIGNDVEIGALCAIDRALAGVTKISDRVKLDNLVQVAHNVQIGEGTVIASQTGIAGSSSLGSCVMVGGQVGVKDHVAVGDRVVLATRVGIYRNVPDGSVMAGGVPAMPHKVFLRAQSFFKRLPELMERIRRLEKFVNFNGKERP